MKKKILLLISVLIILSLIFFPKGYSDFFKVTNKGIELLISKTLDSNKRIEKLWDSEDIFLEASQKYGLQNMSYDRPSKTLYLGVSSLNIQLKNEIEKHFEEELKKVHVYDYDINVYRIVP